MGTTDWASKISNAQRAKEKLDISRGKVDVYLGLLEQIQKMESDPDMALYLGEEASSSSEIQPSPATEPAQRQRAPSSRGKGQLLLKLLRDAGLEEFEPADAVGYAEVIGDEEAVKGLTEKQANGILRHLAATGHVVVVQPGKRGKSGKMPRYKLADPPPEPRRTSLDMEDI